MGLPRGLARYLSDDYVERKGNREEDAKEGQGQLFLACGLKGHSKIPSRFQISYNRHLVNRLFETA